MFESSPKYQSPLFSPLSMRNSLTLPDTFGDALRLLRKRAQLTQDELGRAVGYSREQIARLENGTRLPDLAVIAALFVPALFERQETRLVEQFMALAGQTRADQQVTITHTRRTRVQLSNETIAAPSRPLHLPPAPLVPLLGRDQEVAELRALLRTARLVTLMGAPGIGKSRLALEVANLAAAEFADGAVWIPLADVAAAEDVPYAVVRALALTPSPNQSPAEAIADYLAARRLLLVLDNCEHVLDSAPLFVDWLACSPQLRLLCTSRTPLDLYGEQEWPLAPLSAPDLAQPPDLIRWGETPAMQLLLARARAADPTFALTSDNLLPLATLCVALDGLPLALELAAVRLRELPPQALVQQLLALRGHGQLSSTWLQQTRRNVAERHRTLQAAIDWSVRMLPPDQQSAFFYLGVFVGGCTTEAAATIAAADPALLASLARASLLALAGDRVTLLETLRVYASERLAAVGDLAEGQQRHAVYYAAFAHQVFDGLLGEEQATWMQRGLADHNNCLAALRWALAGEQGDLAVSLASSLWWFWYRQGLFALGTEMLQAALRLSSTNLSQRARALNGLASFHLVHDDYAASLACHEEGLTLRRALGDALGVATALHNMALTAHTMGDSRQALAWLQESIDADPSADPAQAWAHMGVIALDMLDLAQARQWLERAHAQVMQEPAGWMQAFVQLNLADVLWECRDIAAARRMAQRSLDLFTALSDAYYLPDPQLLLAQIAHAEGDDKLAGNLCALARDQYEARQDVVLTASALLLEAELARSRGDLPQAATLREQAAALRRSVKRPLNPREQARYAGV